MKAQAAAMCGLLLSACAGAPFERAGWRGFDIAVEGRTLMAALPRRSVRGEVLTVVVEGDGRAHDARGRPAADPTPADPVGFAIARAWPEGPVAWLGRPCQYVRDADHACRVADWTTDRFSPAAIDLLDRGVDALKAETGASRVQLVGWSGGGVAALALARRRSDVAGLMTVAAPLDVAAWTRFHGLTPLDAPSVEPLATAQAHIFGSRDRVTPPSVGVDAARRLAGGRGVVEVWDERHDCCWADRAGDLARSLAVARSAGR